MPIWVTTKCEIRDRPDDSGIYAHLEGRRSGVMAWLASVFGIDEKYSLVVEKDMVEVSETSIFKSVRRVTRIDSIDATLYGAYRPWIQSIIFFCFIYAMWSVLAFIFVAIQHRQARDGDALASWVFPIGLCIALACASAYFSLNRSVMLGYVESNGDRQILRFKRSLIEGKTVDEDQAARVCELLHSLKQPRSPHD